jgi:hypothetical protein
MADDKDKLVKTWTPQQIPPGVHGSKPKPDKEPTPDPPKRPEKK